MSSNLNGVRVSGFAIGNLEVKLEGDNGTLGEALDKLGVTHDGRSWSINGRSIPASEVRSTPVRNGDRVTAAPSNKGGN